MATTEALKRRGNKTQTPAQKLSNKVANKNKSEEYSIPNGAVHVCTCCGKHATKTSLEERFYISYSPFHAKTGRAPICKECVVNMSTINGEIIINMFVEVIRVLDKPLLNSLLESAITQQITDAKKENGLLDREHVLKNRASGIIGYYIKNISMPQYKSMTWLDGEQRYIPNGMADKVMIDENGDEFGFQELVYKWGEGLSELDFDYLEQRFSALTAMANVEFESDAMLLKEICLEQLDLRNIRKKGGETKNKLENIQKLMASANIRPTDIKNANSDLLNDSYGKWLSVIENDEPATYFKDKPLYEDFDNIKTYFADWVLRPLKNLLANQRDFSTIMDGDDNG